MERTIAEVRLNRGGAAAAMVATPCGFLCWRWRCGVAIVGVCLGDPEAKNFALSL
jgi:hypothetical protein